MCVRVPWRGRPPLLSPSLLGCSLAHLSRAPYLHVIKRAEACAVFHQTQTLNPRLRAAPGSRDVPEAGCGLPEPSPGADRVAAEFNSLHAILRWCVLERNLGFSLFFFLLFQWRFFEGRANRMSTSLTS